MEPSPSAKTHTGRNLPPDEMIDPARRVRRSRRDLRRTGGVRRHSRTIDPKRPARTCSKRSRPITAGENLLSTTSSSMRSAAHDGEAHRHDSESGAGALEKRAVLRARRRVNDIPGRSRRLRPRRTTHDPAGSQASAATKTNSVAVVLPGHFDVRCTSGQALSAVSLRAPFPVRYPKSFWRRHHSEAGRITASRWSSTKDFTPTTRDIASRKVQDALLRDVASSWESDAYQGSRSRRPRSSS